MQQIWNKKSIFILLVTIAFAWTFAWVFLTPFCGMVFHCGCTWLWAGAAEKCVGAMDMACIQHTCPWCDDGKLGMIIPLSIILFSQALAICLFWWKYNSNLLLKFIFQILIGIVTFILSGHFEAVVHGWIKNYPR